MKLILSPMRCGTPLAVFRSGESLTLNGEAFDFSQVPDGATLPRAAIASDWIAGDIERIGGLLHVPLILPHGARAPRATLVPAPITLTDDGPVALPPFEEEADA
jgi:hypothetical protein